MTESPAELACAVPDAAQPRAAAAVGRAVADLAADDRRPQPLGVTDITAVDNDDFLAIFANLVTRDAARGRSRPHVTLGGHRRRRRRDRTPPARWKDAKAPQRPARARRRRRGSGRRCSRPRVVVPHQRRHRGRAWSRTRGPSISSPTFWLAGTAQDRGRARARSASPRRSRRSPRSVEVVLGEPSAATGQTARVAPFHGQSGGARLRCDSSGAGAAGAAPFALFDPRLLVPLRRVRLRVKRLGRAPGASAALVWLAALACLPGCSCGSAPCGDTDCLAGDVERGSAGRFTNRGRRQARDGRDLRPGLGDLVVVDATEPREPQVHRRSTASRRRHADLRPRHATAVASRTRVRTSARGRRSRWRAAWRMSRTRIATRWRSSSPTRRSRTSGRATRSTTPADGGGRPVRVAMTIDGAKRPAIAYLALGVDDGASHRTTELRLRARARTRARRRRPTGPTRRSPTGTGHLRRAVRQPDGLRRRRDRRRPADLRDATTTTARTTCADDRCLRRWARAAPASTSRTSSSPPPGTGALRHARRAARRPARRRVLRSQRGARSCSRVESAAGRARSPRPCSTATTPGDRGMWASAIVDGGGTVHIAYQDALGDQLMYTHVRTARRARRTSSTTAHAPATARTRSARARRSTWAAARRRSPTRTA